MGLKLWEEAEREDQIVEKESNHGFMNRQKYTGNLMVLLQNTMHPSLDFRWNSCWFWEGSI